MFSKNQADVLQSLRRYEFKTSGVYVGKVKPDLGTDLFISDRTLFKEALKTPNLGKLVLASYHDPVLKRNIPRVIKLIGCYRIYNNLMSAGKVILSFNDHTSYNVLLHSIAKKHQLKTVYIQHAAVSDKFPPLYHDYNLLFSEDSLNKYKRLPGIVAEVLFDLRIATGLQTTELDQYPKENSMLVCTNLLDDPLKVLAFVEKMSGDYEIVLRPHPRDHRKEWSQARCRISTNTSVWDDLKECRIVITNESAVVLEAICAGRLLYKAAFFSSSLDNYSFLQKGLLLREYSDISSISDAINEKSLDYDTSRVLYFTGEMINAREKVAKFFKSIP